MPTVQAVPRANSDGNVISQFTSHAGSTAITYTYPSTQDNLEILNKGSVNLVLNVGTFTNQTITPGQKWKNDVSFSSFDIKSAAGNGEFVATSMDYAQTNATILKGTTAQRPANAVIGQPYFDTTLGKPVWKKTATTWCDATGLVV